MVIHKCTVCNFSSTQKTAYKTHLTTQKHKRNTKDIPIIISKSNNNEIMFTIVENQNNLAKQNEEVIKQNEDLKKEIEKLKETNKILLDTNNDEAQAYFTGWVVNEIDKFLKQIEK